MGLIDGSSLLRCRGWGWRWNKPSWAFFGFHFSQGWRTWICSFCDVLALDSRIIPFLLLELELSEHWGIFLLHCYETCQAMCANLSNNLSLPEFWRIELYKLLANLEPTNMLASSPSTTDVGSPYFHCSPVKPDPSKCPQQKALSLSPFPKKTPIFFGQISTSKFFTQHHVISPSAEKMFLGLFLVWLKHPTEKSQATWKPWHSSRPMRRMR